MIIPCSIFFVGCMKEESSGYVITFLVDNQPYLTLNTTGNEALELPDNPIKVGYTFNGWYLDEDFESLFDNEYYLDRELTEDINIYAKFTVNQYTIIFNTNEGSAIAPITQDYNSTISKPTDPTKNGYIFAGWFTDNGTFNNEYTFTTMPLNGIILYAKWSISESSAYNAYLSSIELLLNSSKLQMEYNTESKWGTTAGVEMVINNEYYHTIKYNEYPEDYCWSVQENGIWYDYMMEGYLYNGKPSYDYIKDTSIWVSETRSPQQNLVVIIP